MAKKVSAKKTSGKTKTTVKKRRVWLWLVVIVALPVLMLGIFELRYRQAVMPGVMLAGMDVAGANEEELRETISEAVGAYQAEWPVSFGYEANVWESNFDKEAMEYDVDETVARLLGWGKVGRYDQQLMERWQLWRMGEEVGLVAAVDDEYLDYLTASMSAQLDVEAVPVSLEVVETASGSGVVVHAGEPGRRFEVEVFEQELVEAVSYLRKPDYTLPVVALVDATTPQQMRLAQERAELMLERELALTYEDDFDGQDWQLSGEELVSLVGFEEDFDRDKVAEYVAEIAGVVERPAQDARFVFNDDTNRVEEFVPAKQGVGLDVETTTKRMLDSLMALETEDDVEAVTIVVRTTDPEITTKHANDLGIETLLGRGLSTYRGSIPSRVHNVSLAAQRITGALVKPGEEFSFNAYVGDISKSTGYQEAYVIQNGRTELGDGGGVCQDSTTVFRAALDAGLPITERRGHSYRVGYYEQNAKPGLDATVFAPTTDLKFLNDTPGHILIQVTADSANRSMVVEIYGTDDGRTAKVSNHVVWDISPPPPDEYIDDPTLAPGELKQIDWKAGGAKAKFDYVVMRDGELIYEKNFYTAYRPWSAKFLRGVEQG